jgi:hypothetical protein
MAGRKDSLKGLPSFYQTCSMVDKTPLRFRSLQAEVAAFMVYSAARVETENQLVEKMKGPRSVVAGALP